MDIPALKKSYEWFFGPYNTSYKMGDNGSYLCKLILKYIHAVLKIILNNKDLEKYHSYVKNGDYRNSFVKIAEEITSQSDWILKHSENLLEYVHPIWAGEKLMLYEGTCKHIYKEVITNKPSFVSFSDRKELSSDEIIRRGLSSNEIERFVECYEYDIKMWGLDSGSFGECEDFVKLGFMTDYSNALNLSDEEYRESSDYLDFYTPDIEFEFGEMFMKYLCYCWNFVDSQEKVDILRKRFNDLFETDIEE